MCSGEGREGLFLFWGVPWSWEAGRFDPGWGEDSSISSRGEKGGVLGIAMGEDGVSISSASSPSSLPVLVSPPSFLSSIISNSSSSSPLLPFLPPSSPAPISSDTSPSFSGPSSSDPSSTLSSPLSHPSRSFPFSSTSLFLPSSLLSSSLRLPSTSSLLLLTSSGVVSVLLKGLGMCWEGSSSRSSHP